MKNLIRKQFKQTIKNIPTSRREEGLKHALTQLSIDFNHYRHVLSYASFNDEFCTQEINKTLAKEGKLILPKIEGNKLKLFHVTSPEKQLTRNNLGILEPHPERCIKATNLKSPLIIVPGLCFDKNKNRIGYGKGFYDRLLNSFSAPFTSLGIGYKEQLSTHLLPTLKTDFQLSKVKLF